MIAAECRLEQIGGDARITLHQAELDENVDALLADHPNLREEIEESDARGIEIPADEVFARLRDQQRRFEKEAGR